MREAVNRFLMAYFALWARLVLRARRPYVVGVTGSVGKTTTKEAVAAVLMHPDARAAVGTVRKTPASRNDFLWFTLVILGYGDRPKSLLRWAARCCTAPLRALALATVAPYPDTLVLEYAANTVDGIARRAALAPPTVAVVTAIGPAHLDGFKTVEQIVQSKGALVRAVAPTGFVVLGADNRYTSGMDSMTAARVEKVAGRGEQLARNVARVIGRHVGVEDDVIDRALRDLGPVKGRLGVVEIGTLTLIDDAHNANPLSMQLGLDTLSELAGAGRRKVAILGEMGELGPEARRYHEEVAAYARGRADLLVGVGELARHYDADHWFATAADCANALPTLVCPSDCVLVKGSHSVRLRVVVQRLEHLAPELASNERATSG